MLHLFSIVRAQPSTAMSCVASKKHNTKKMIVSGRICGVLSTPSPISSLINGDNTNINTPMRSCVGINQLLRLPKRLMYKESTSGAHKSFTLKD